VEKSNNIINFSEQAKGLRRAQNPEDHSWECVAGAKGDYWGIPVTYQGCGIIPPIEPRPGRYVRRSCACERAAKDASQVTTWSGKQIAETFGWLGLQWSDAMLAQKTFGNFISNRQPEAFRMTQEFVEILVGVLILHGPFGTGKTHLLAALINELRMQGKGSLFVTAPKLFNVIQERIGLHESYAPLITKAISTPLLVIDDIDKASWTDFRESIYFTIVDERVKRGLPFAISTNRLAELPNFVGGAVASRFSIGQIAIEMLGDDYRKEL